MTGQKIFVYFYSYICLKFEESSYVGENYSYKNLRKVDNKFF